jgi:hypothetical protein
MIAALAVLNANKNIIAVVGLVMLGGMIVTGLYTAGQRAERNKQAAEVGKVNTVIVEDRGKDEAEIAASDAEAKKIDAAVAKQLELKMNQRFILDEETAKLLGSVR